MTRETKVGLVVSCSFLCLVGAVVAVKMRQPADAIAQADSGNSPPATGKPKAAPESGEKMPPAPEVNVPPPPDKGLPKADPLALPAIPSPTDAPTQSADAGESTKHARGKPSSESHLKTAAASEPAVEPPPGAPPTGGNSALLPSISNGDKSSTPAGTEPPIPPPLPGAGPTPALEPPPHAAAVPQPGPDAGAFAGKEKEGGNDRTAKEKRDHKESGEKEKDKAIPTAPPTEPSSSTGTIAPPPGTGAVPLPSLSEPGPPPPTAAPLPGPKPEVANEHINGSPPPSGAPAPIPAVEPPPPSPSPAPIGNATPLPPIGGMASALEKSAPGPRPAPVGKADAPSLLPTAKSDAPLPAPIGKPDSPAPIGSPSPEPLHSDFIPKGPPPGTEPPPATPASAPIGDSKKNRVTLEPIRPVSDGVVESNPPTGARTPGNTPAPIGSPTPPSAAPTQPVVGTLLPAALPPQPAPQPQPAALPPIGSAVGNTTPPIRLPEAMPAKPLAPAAQPVTTQVISYEEMRHTLAPGETYESLSKQFYNSDAYAKALQMWNQNHPRASDAMARDGSIVPGEKLFVPPVEQLEQHYAAVIPNLKAAPRPSGTVQTSFTGSAPSAADFTYYKVVKDESVEIISRATLGTGDRANDVLRLNPNLRAGQNVPAGTLLLLPAGARVPPENAR
jgi:LysM repeat protein